MISIGSIQLGNVPAIAVIIDRMVDLDVIATLSDRGANLIELRIDCFSEPFEDVLAFCDAIRKKSVLPIIGTLRETDYNRNNRLSMFEKIMPFVDAIDIEIDATIISDVIVAAVNKTIIISEHIYNKMPSIAKLNKTTDIATALGADIVKIATMPQCTEDVTSLLSFTLSRSEPMITIAMGNMGKISRLVAPLFGSLYSYAFITESVALGQIQLDELVTDFLRYYSK